MLLFRKMKEKYNLNRENQKKKKKKEEPKIKINQKICKTLYCSYQRKNQIMCDLKNNKPKTKYIYCIKNQSRVMFSSLRFSHYHWLAFFVIFSSLFSHISNGVLWRVNRIFSGIWRMVYDEKKKWTNKSRFKWKWRCSELSSEFLSGSDTQKIWICRRQWAIKFSTMQLRRICAM